MQSEPAAGAGGIGMPIFPRVSASFGQRAKERQRRGGWRGGEEREESAVSCAVDNGRRDGKFQRKKLDTETSSVAPQSGMVRPETVAD